MSPRRAAALLSLAIPLAACDLVTEPEGPRPEDFDLATPSTVGPEAPVSPAASPVGDVGDRVEAAK